MSHQMGERDYPVVDRARDDEDPDAVYHPDRTGDGTEADPHAEAEFHASQADDGTRLGDRDGDGVRDENEGPDGHRSGGVVPGEVVDVTDDGPAHRRNEPVDAVPGEAGLAGPGDPFPGDGLGDPPRNGETTVIPVDDVAAQDSGVVLVPPAPDARDAADRDRSVDEPLADGPVDTETVVVPADPGVPSGPDAGVVPVPVPVPVPAPADQGVTSQPGAAPSGDDAWRELQLNFVDDPAAAVRDAAGLLEQAVADLRRKHEGSDSTEDLRTAFRKYRDVYRNLR